MTQDGLHHLVCAVVVEGLGEGATLPFFRAHPALVCMENIPVGAENDGAK